MATKREIKEKVAKTRKAKKPKEEQIHLSQNPTAQAEPPLESSPVILSSPKLPSLQSIQPQSMPSASSSQLEIKKQDNYVKFIVFLMLGLVIIVGFIAWNNYESTKFEYVGLQFEKILFDQLPLYRAQIPITSPTGNVVANYDLHLRNDPRELENIPINGRIRLKQEAILGLDQNSLEGCADNSFAGVTLSQFLAVAGVKAVGGTTDLTYSIRNDVKFASCENVVDSVIILEKGEKTQILQEGPDCFKIQASSCEDLIKAAERFIVGTIGHSSGYDV